MQTLLVPSEDMKVSLSFTWHSGPWQPLHFRFLQPGRHSKENVTGCLLWYLLAPAKNHTHTPPSAWPVTANLTCCSFPAGTWKDPRDNRPELPTFLLPRRGRNSQDEPTALSFPRRDRGHFPARGELSQASTSAIPRGPLSHQFSFQGAMVIN